MCIVLCHAVPCCAGVLPTDASAAVVPCRAACKHSADGSAWATSLPAALSALPQSLLLSRLCVGFGLAGAPVAFTLMMELLPASSRALWGVLIELAWTAGTIGEAVLAWAVLNTQGWRLLLLLSTTPLSCVSLYRHLRRDGVSASMCAASLPGYTCLALFYMHVTTDLLPAHQPSACVLLPACCVHASALQCCCLSWSGGFQSRLAGSWLRGTQRVLLLRCGRWHR